VFGSGFMLGDGVWEGLRMHRGPHPADGIWGAHWYDKVNASTGFGAPPGPLPQLGGEYQKTADACREDYEFIRSHAIEA